jgi:hypothetical protein
MANVRVVHYVRVRSDDSDSLQRLLALDGVDAGCRPRPRRTPDGIEIELFVEADALSQLTSDPALSVEVGENVMAQAQARLAEVGVGDRFDGGRITPRGIGEAV